MASQTIADLALGSKIYLYENGEPVEYFIAEHGTLETTIVRGLLLGDTRQMNATNVATYNGCDMDVWLSDSSSGFLSIFDIATRSSFTSKSIKVWDNEQEAVVELARMAFLLSATEVGYNSQIKVEGTSIMPSLLIYRETTDASTARLAFTSSGGSATYVLRTPSSATKFAAVNGANSIQYSYDASGLFYVRPAISVLNTTSVSDDTEETIYLLPDPNKKYTSVDGIMIVGTASSRPSKARLIIPVNNLYDVELYVSNNAGDSSPVWVACTNGGTCTLANTTKETTAWTLGVKMYGKSGGRGSFGEPVLLVEEDAT